MNSYSLNVSNDCMSLRNVFSFIVFPFTNIFHHDSHVFLPHFSLDRCQSNWNLCVHRHNEIKRWQTHNKEKKKIIFCFPCFLCACDSGNFSKKIRICWWKMEIKFKKIFVTSFMNFWSLFDDNLLFFAFCEKQKCSKRVQLGHWRLIWSRNELNFPIF